MDFGRFCEIAFLLCFFVSWPVTIRKSLKSKTSKGRSVLFEIFLFLGYLAGIVGKFWAWHYNGEFQWVTLLYMINGTMVMIDIWLYYRNRRLDERRETGEEV